MLHGCTRLSKYWRTTIPTSRLLKQTKIVRMNPKADWNSVVIQNGLQFGLGLVDQIDFMAEGDAS